jgi:hypothetical protein
MPIGSKQLNNLLLPVHVNEIRVLAVDPYLTITNIFILSREEVFEDSTKLFLWTIYPFLASLKNSRELSFLPIRARRIFSLYSSLRWVPFRAIGITPTGS